VEKATALANALALEYLRSQMLQQITREAAEAERELVRLSAVYGTRDPRYMNVRTKLENLQSQRAATHQNRCVGGY
jgi:hypothetical protein